MTPSHKKDVIDYLIRRQFLNDVKLAAGGSVSHTSQERRETVNNVVAAFKAQLLAKSPNEIETLLQTEKKKEFQELRTKAELEKQQRFFNQPDADADFEYWSKAQYWTLNEAIALAFGKAPEVVTWDKVKLYTKISPFAKEYARTRELALRAEAWNKLYDPVLPGLFLVWAKKVGLKVPDELVEEVEKWGIAAVDWKDMYDQIKEKYDALGEQGNELIAVMENLRQQCEQTEDTHKNERSLANSDHWKRFRALTLRAIDEYPSWSQDQGKVQKTGNLQEWLTKTIGADNREAEILKKILSDFFPALK